MSKTVSKGANSNLYLCSKHDRTDMDFNQIKNLAQLVIKQLENLEQTTGLCHLERMQDSPIKNEAHTILSEINTIKYKLSQLQQVNE